MDLTNRIKQHFCRENIGISVLLVLCYTIPCFLELFYDQTNSLKGRHIRFPPKLKHYTFVGDIYETKLMTRKCIKWPKSPVTIQIVSINSRVSGLNNIYFIILYMYNYYIATRNNTQYNEFLCAYVGIY